MASTGVKSPNPSPPAADVVFDVAVLGLGSHGSATAYHLARRGLRVVGFDAFKPPHVSGSHGGLTRIIREAYYEDPIYVPMLRRTYELFRELEATRGEKLLVTCGGINIGPRDGTLIQGVLASVTTHNIPHEVLDAAAIRRRYPQFNIADGAVAVFEKTAGYVYPEKTIAAHLELAAKHGATLHYNEPALQWEQESEDRVVVLTSQRRVVARHLVLAVGGTMASLLKNSGFDLKLEVTRQLSLWFQPPTAELRALHDASKMPVFIWEHTRDRYIYGFPSVDGEGVKFGIHGEGRPLSQHQVPRNGSTPVVRESDEDIASVRDMMARLFPGANGELARVTPCMYTHSEDSHFRIGFLPRYPRVLVVSACSGHGFKFSPVMGELCADLVQLGKSRFDLSLFQLDAVPVGTRKVPTSGAVAAAVELTTIAKL